MRKITAIIMAVFVSAILFVPVFADEYRLEGLPQMVDDADLLTPEEEARLEAQLQEIRERQQFDVVVVTENSIGDKAPAAFADDYFDYMGYGCGPDRDGILLLLNMDSRDWIMSTSGYGVTAFTDAGQKYMSEQFLPDLGDGEYAKAFEKFAELSDDFVTQARSGEPYDSGNLPKGSVSPFWIFGDLAIGGAAGYVTASRRKNQLKELKPKKTAADYTAGLVISQRYDNLVDRQVTSEIISKSSDSGSSGSTTHTGSAGNTHGGSGGKF